MLKPRYANGDLKPPHHYTRTFYHRDAQGNVLSVMQERLDEQQEQRLFLQEQYMYGSQRIGKKSIQKVWEDLPDNENNENSLIFAASRNHTFFEISNHLGNVHLVLSDYLSITGDGSGNITGYHSSVSGASEYYPLGMLLVEGEYDSQSYRYWFNTQERADEVKGSGNHYTATYWEYNPRAVHRWNMDPKASSTMSPYAILAGNSILYTDWLGDSILAIYDRDLNQLRVLDLDHYDPSKPFEHVGPDDYIVGGVYDDEGNIIKNQMLVIEGFFTGGESDSRGNITYGNNENQLPIPAINFEVLEHGDEGWYRLDPKDSNPRNDQYDNPTVRNAQGELRGQFRLHLGTVSHGCITGNEHNRQTVKGYEVLEQILEQTSTSQVRDNLGRLSWLLNRTVTRYGEIHVR